MKNKRFLVECFEPRILFTSYDAATDFSTTQNPSGPWSYGVRYTETADYAPFPVEGQLDFGSGAVGWNENSGSPPYVGINATGQEYDSEGITLPTGVLVMHPGGNGEYADLRFTAPTAATLAVSYSAVGIDTNGTTTDEHVLQNGQEIGSGSINGYQQQAQGSYKVSVVPGDTLDFLVGPGSNNTYYSDATSMSVQITPTGATEDHLVFTQQPKDGNVRTPEPTQVKIEDAKNHVVTTATDGVTLYLQDSPTDQLKLEYVPFVRGVASFTGANAPLIFPGTETFVAEESNSAGQFSGSAGEVTSTSFNISQVHLAFTKQPAVAGANQPFSVTVELQDDKNRQVKAPAGELVNLFLYNLDSGLTENIARPVLVNGKPISLTIVDPGTCELTASEINASGQNIDPTTNATTAPFSVLGNHLRFLKQPGNIDTGTAASFIVGLVDYKNRPVATTGLSGSIVALLDGSLGELAVVPLTLVNGKYDNSKAATGSALVIPTAGTYSITVADVIPGTDVDAGEGIAPISSLDFAAVNPHLVFTRQPTTTGVFAPVSFAVELLNKENRPAFPNTGGAILVQFGVAGAEPVSAIVTLQNSKYDNLKPPAGQAPLTVPGVTTSMIAVTQADTEDALPIASPATVYSAQFQVVADHLVFQRQPSTVAANALVPFQVVIEDPKNQPVTALASFSEALFIGLNTITGSGTIPIPSAFDFSVGQYNNLTDGGDAAIKISAPGTYTLTAGVVAYGMSNDSDFSAVTSKVFKIV